MNWTNLAGLLVVLLCLGAMLTHAYLRRAHPYEGFRPIPAFSRFLQSVYHAVESGSRVHISLGSSSLLSPSNTSALVGLSVLKRVAQIGATGDKAPLVTAGESTLAILGQDTLRNAFREANALGDYSNQLGRLTGLTPFSYAVGTFPVFRHEDVTVSYLCGSFGPEAGLLADSAEHNAPALVTGSESVQAQALYYASAEEPLIGEELYASGAYLQAGTLHAASLRAEDTLRWIVLAGLILGSLLKLVGLL